MDRCFSLLPDMIGFLWLSFVSKFDIIVQGIDSSLFLVQNEIIMLKVESCIQIYQPLDSESNYGDC